MTKQEIQALIDAKIAGQGSAVDVGGALPKILSEILDAAFAGANVQSDWAQSDNAEVDFIKNKPLVIPVTDLGVIDFSKQDIEDERPVSPDGIDECTPAIRVNGKIYFNIPITTKTIYDNLKAAISDLFVELQISSEAGINAVWGTFYTDTDGTFMTVVAVFRYIDRGEAYLAYIEN